MRFEVQDTDQVQHRDLSLRLCSFAALRRPPELNPSPSSFQPYISAFDLGRWVGPTPRAGFRDCSRHVAPRVGWKSKHTSLVPQLMVGEIMHLHYRLPTLILQFILPTKVLLGIASYVLFGVGLFARKIVFGISFFDFSVFR